MPMQLKNKIDHLRQFVTKNYLKIIFIVVPLGAVIFLVTFIGYNQTTTFCYSCHFEKGPFVYIHKDRPVHKDIDAGTFSCAKCHKDKTVQTIYHRNIKEAQNFSQRVANLRFTEPIDPRRTFNTEQCLICHPDRLNVDERETHLLKSDKLRQIGLRFNKSIHFRFETFRAEDQKLYEMIKAQNVTSRDDQQELELLEKIKLGNCGQCHLRTKKEANGETIIDKQVNFVARNPITCAGCHEDVDPLTHPGKPLATPSEEICQKCHHGKIHGKFLIFKAECEDLSNTENCVKCHPYIGNWVNR